MNSLLFALVYAALLAIALGMKAHHTTLRGTAPLPSVLRRWRLAGGMLLALALTLEVVRDGTSLGLVTWCAATTLAGMLITLGLARVPRWIWAPATVALLASGVEAMAGWAS